jgi:hypothetical protein
MTIHATCGIEALPYVRVTFFLVIAAFIKDLGDLILDHVNGCAWQSENLPSVSMKNSAK